MYILHHVKGDVGFELKLDDVCDSHGVVCICTGMMLSRVFSGMKSDNSCGGGGVYVAEDAMDNNPKINNTQHTADKKRIPQF